MATLWEQKKAEQAKQLQQQKLIAAVGGTAVEIGKQAVITQGLQTGAAASIKGFQSASVLAGIIELVGTIGVAAYSFFSTKKQAKARERLTKQQSATQNSVEGILEEIEATGLAIVEQYGVDPTTPEFEKILYDNLFQTIGYRGNCNATVWAPDSKPGQANRPVMFYITGNGRKITPGPGLVAPPNLQTYWYVQCRNAKDSWVNAYADLLIREGRIRELEEFQASLDKGKKIIRITYALIFIILGVIVFYNATKIKV